VVRRLARWFGSVSLIVVGGSGHSPTSSSSDAPAATPLRRSSYSGTTSSDVGDQQPQRVPTAGLPVDRNTRPDANAADAATCAGRVGWSSDHHHAIQMRPMRTSDADPAKVKDRVRAPGSRPDL
jgi:hypothetical protein